MRQMADSPVSLADFALTFEIEDAANRQAVEGAIQDRRLWKRMGNKESARRGAAATNGRR